MAALHPSPQSPIETLRQATLFSAVLILGGASLLDLLVLALGTGGILLMAAYAALCDRI